MESHRPAINDVFAYHAIQLASHVRLLFFARDAGDSNATELILFYLTEYMQKVLHRHLTLCDPEWNDSKQTSNEFSYRWFDGLNAEPEFLAPGLLRFRGDAYWLIGQKASYYDPVDFAIELCPKTGEFQKYLFCFGDSRSMDLKVQPSGYPIAPVVEWTYRFEQRSTDSSRAKT